MTNNDKSIPLNDLMVNRILNRMKELGLTEKQLCTSPTHDYPNISKDQFRSIKEFKEGQKPKNRGHSISEIKLWMLEVFRENLGCSKDYLLGDSDDPNKDKNGRVSDKPLIFNNNITKSETRHNLTSLGHKIESLDNQTEINILYYIFFQADPTTRKQIIADLNDYVNEHKKMSYTAEKWQQANSMQEKQAALSLIYNIGVGDDIKDILECFFDAEVYYNQRNFYDALIRYAKIITTKDIVLQVKPYMLDAIARVQYIITHEGDFSEEHTGLNKLSNDDYYNFINNRFSKKLDELKTYIEQPLAKPTENQTYTLKALYRLSRYLN